jgi:hypothetical protein
MMRSLAHPKPVRRLNDESSLDLRAARMGRAISENLLCEAVEGAGAVSEPDAVDQQL